MQEDRNIWEEKIKWKGIIWKNNCPFCKLEKKEKKLVIFNTKHWEIRYNKYPYGWIKKHVLVFPKRHVEFSKNLNDLELLDLKNIHKYLYDFYETQKYFSFLRETFKWRSIKHLHYHYMPGNIHSNNFAEILNKQWY